MKPHISFSHRYRKLCVLDVSQEARLLLVIDVNLKDLPEHFLQYDTDDGLFELPKSGKYLLLVFSGAKGAFTTLRAAWPPRKEKYYRENIGQIFDVRLPETI